MGRRPTVRPRKGNGGVWRKNSGILCKFPKSFLTPLRKCNFVNCEKILLVNTELTWLEDIKMAVINNENGLIVMAAVIVPCLRNLRLQHMSETYQMEFSKETFSICLIN